MSRGASARQVTVSYALESLLLAALAIALGPPLARIGAVAVGMADGFLQFVRRPPLEARLDLRTYAYAAAGGVYFSLAMMIPALRACRRTIVEHKRRSARARERLPWRRFAVDLLLLGAALWGYWGYLSRSRLLAQLGSSGAGVPVDPLLFVLSTVFVLGVALLVLRLFPVLLRLLFRAGRRAWSPAAYAALLEVGRGASEATFLMLFLILTVSTGIFSGNSARTINWNVAAKTRYMVGADVTLRERWAPLGSEDPAGVAEVREPPFRRFRELEGVRLATPVLRRDGVTVEGGSSTVSDAYLMAVVPHEFGQVAFFRDDLYDRPWYEYLNLLTAARQGAVLSRSLALRYGLSVGDTVHVSWGGNERLPFVVQGFVDYWPTYNPLGAPFGLPLTAAGQGGSGARRSTLTPAAAEGTTPQSGMVVVNLEYVRTQGPVEGYEVWMALEEEASSEALYGSLGVQGISLEAVQNARQAILDYKNDPELQGTNGILTLGFMATLLICLVGFLVHVTLSFGSRTLQFGLLRAMGLSASRVRAMVLYEQLLTSGVALLLGALIGELDCVLFVPMLRHIFGSVAEVPPFRVVAFVADYLKLYAVVAASLAAGFVVLARMLARTRIHQALKLGEE
jgi:putative ABC transport system permease protein